MKRLWIAAALILLLGIPLSAQGQDNTPLPACADLYNANLRVSDLEEAVGAGAVYCREIARDSQYIINPGAIGDQSVIERSVQQAYDVFGMTVEGSAAKTFSHAITVCLQGRGDLLFLPAFTSPRPVQSVQAFVKGDYTCMHIGSPGTVALVTQ